MAKNTANDKAYNEERDTAPHRETGNINSRNNNTGNDTDDVADETIERANNTGLGDAGQNDEKLTSHTQNHSSDA